MTNAPQTNEHTKVPLLVEITKRWPSLVYISLGLFLAYFYLMSEGSSWLSDIEINARFANVLNIYTMAIMAGLLIISGFAPKYAAKLIEHKHLLLWAGLAGAISSVLILLAGPFFLNNGSLFNLGAIILGVVCSVFTLAYGKLLSQIKPAKALLYVSLSFLLFTISYFVIAGSSTFHITEGAPSISGALAIIVLPLLMGVFANHGIIAAKSKGLLDANLTGEMPNLPDLSTADDQTRSASYSTKAFAKLIIASFIFGISASILKSNFMENSHISDVRGLNSIDMMLLALFCFIIILVSVRYKGKFSFGKAYLLAMLVIAISSAVVPILTGENVYLAAVSSFFYNTYDLIIWCLVAFIAYQNRSHDVKITALGRGFLILGTLCGILMSLYTIPLLRNSVDFSAQILYSIIAVIILICALFVFTERDMNSLFNFSSLKDEYDTSLQLRCATCIIMTGADSGAHNTANNLIAAESPKPFRIVIDRLATQYCLSNREKEVFIELAHGRNTVHVAKRLFISENTVRSHTRSIYSKLNVTSHDALVDIVDEEYRVSKAA